MYISNLESRKSRRKKKSKSKKILKGILISIPIFFIVSGILIVSLAGWELTKQTFFLAKTLMTDYKPELPPKKFIGLYTKRPEPGENIGEISIPAISLKYPLIHGTLSEHLKKGVGHYAGSTLPGEKGNVILSGHRDTVFRNLGEVKKGDLIIIKTKYGTFTYTASKIRIVDKDDRTVIVPGKKEMLTLTTCYPFTYVGNAPKRYVLTADFIKHEPPNNQKNINQKVKTRK